MSQFPSVEPVAADPSELLPVVEAPESGASLPSPIAAEPCDGAGLPAAPEATDSSEPAELFAPTDEARPHPGGPGDLAGIAEDPAASGEPLKLQQRHLKALRALAAGCSMQEAARAAGVNRSTVYRWLSEHPAVRAAYTAWKSATQASAHSRLLAMQDLAVEVLEEALAEKRDGRLAAHILEKTGALAPPTPGPTRPDRAAIEIAAAQREEDVRIANRAEQAQRDACWNSVQSRFPDPPKTP